MATVNKKRKNRDVPCPPGGGGNCRPAGASKPSIGANISGGRGRGYVITKEDEEEGRKKRIGERIKSSAKKVEPNSTVPGKDKPKNSGFFGGVDQNDAKYGKKVVKKAKVGSKIVNKSKKK